MKDILEKSIGYLLNRTIDIRSRFKQKKLVTAAQKFLKAVNIPDMYQEEKALLLELIQLHNTHKELSGNLLASQINIEKYPSLKQLYLESINQELIDDEVEEFIVLLSTKSKAYKIKIESNKIIERIAVLNDLSDHELVDKYQKLITEEYLKLVDEQEDTNTLVFEPHNITELIDTISLLAEEAKNKLKVPSMYPYFDSTYLTGGFEAGRIYLFAASPGFGKSTLVLNFAKNFAMQSIPKTRLKSNKPPAIVYVTLENDEVETYIRFSRSLLGKVFTANDITDELKLEMEDKFKQLQNTLIVKYMKPGSSISDFMIQIDTIAEKYRIIAIIVDYMDLLRMDIFDVKEKRHELGMITFTLKILGIKHKCPVISPTQINTQAYSSYLDDKIVIPSLRNLDESRQKAQNADFVGLMFNVPKDVLPRHESFIPYYDDSYRVVGLNIEKNRDNPVGVLYFVTHLPTYTVNFFSYKESEVIHTQVINFRNKKKQYNNNDLPY